MDLEDLILESVIAKAWEVIRRFKDKVGCNRKFEIYNADFWAITEEIKVDFSVSNKRKKKKIQDDQIVSETMKTFNTTVRPTIFTRMVQG